MKKTFKIIGIILITILSIVILFFLIGKIKEIKNEYDRKNSKTLMEYIDNHSPDKVGCLGNFESCYSMEFAAKDFKCDILNDSKVIELNNEYLVLEDNSIYQISFYDLFSNNQNCKKIDVNLDTKSLKYDGSSNILIDKNHDLYSLYFDYDKLNMVINKIEKPYNRLSYEIISNEDIKQILYTSSYMDNLDNMIAAFVLKNDGSIFKQIYKTEYNFNGTNTVYSYTLKNEEILLSNNKYGKILSAKINVKDEASIYESANIEIISFLTEDNYYSLNEIKTEECINYIDVACEKKILASELYAKYKNDIKFIGEDYTLLKDNSIISTSYLSYSLD